MAARYFSGSAPGVAAGSFHRVECARVSRSSRRCIGSCKQRHVTLAASTADWIRYRLPKRYLRRGRGPTCIGQKQRWFLLRLAVPEDQAEFNFKQTAEPEFDGWRWANYWEPVREVIYFKRPVYVRMLTELAPSGGERDHSVDARACGKPCRGSRLRNRARRARSCARPTPLPHP